MEMTQHTVLSFSVCFYFL